MRRPIASLLLLIVMLVGSGCTCIPRRGYAVMYGTGTGSLTNGSRHIYRVDQFATAPQTTDLGASGEKLTDIAIDPCTSRAYAITVDKLFSVDLVTGKIHLLGSLTGLAGLNSLEAACGGPLYVWGISDTRIFQVDPVTLTSQPVADTQRFGGDLALSPDGKELFGTELHEGVLVRVDLSSKKVTSMNLNTDALGTAVEDTVIPGLDFGPDGRLYGTVGNDMNDEALVCRIDPKTGVVTVIGPITKGLGNGGMTINW